MKYYLVDNRWIKLWRTSGINVIELVKFNNKRQALRVFLNSHPYRVNKRFGRSPIVPIVTGQIDIRYVHERNRTLTPWCWMYRKRGKIIEQKRGEQ